MGRKFISGHYYGGVFITTENKSKEISKERCCSLTIWMEILFVEEMVTFLFGIQIWSVLWN